MAGILFLLPLCLVGQEGMTLRDSLRQGLVFFSENNHAGAAAVFRSMEEQFSREPEYPPVREQILPIRAYAHLMIGESAEAVRLFQEYLQMEPKDTRQLAFVLFSLAQAQQTEGQLRAAIDTYQRFMETAPGTPEAEISALRQAELYFECGEAEEGMARLMAFSGGEGTSPTLRTQARLRAVQKAQEQGDVPQLRQLLLDEPWRVDQMPELAILAFAALRAGDDFLQAREYGDAIRAYRLVPPRSLLIRIQQERLDTVEAFYRQQGGDRGALRGVRGDYFRDLLARIRGQLAALRESEDYTPGWQLRLGQAFLMKGRHREALLVFTDLAENEALAESLRAEAHYRWLLTLSARHEWARTREQAAVFLERYPEHPLGADALLLVGNAYQEQGNYEEAVEVFRELCTRYPGHPQLARWEFLLGFNLVLLGDYAEARTILESYPARYPEGLLSVNAALWHALSYFFERKYPEALEHLDHLAVKARGHGQEPEILYRRANTLYAMKHFEEALEAIEYYLNTFPHHLRVPEAAVLRGDILMGKGALLEASTAFAGVGPEAGPLFPYAVFQRGKILRALEEYDLMIRHFQDYLEGGASISRVRVAEALHWIGWAYTQKGEWPKALPVYLEALDKYGNDKQASEVGLILQGLATLHRRVREGLPEELPSGERWETFFNGTDFRTWLADEARRALEGAEFTWYSRVQLYQRDLALRQRDDDRAVGFVMQILEHVESEFLDAQGLAATALVLEDLGSRSAREHFEKILESFPASGERGYAYVGLARAASRKEDTAVAKRYLNRFFQETPMHPAGPEAMLLQGDILIGEGAGDEALELMESLLRLRHARGRPHAHGLALMAKAELSRGRPERAIAYYQRIYNSYRGYPDLVAVAYLESARLFEELGETDPARLTLKEMLEQPALESFTEYMEGRQMLERLGGLTTEVNAEGYTSDGKADT